MHCCTYVGERGHLCDEMALVVVHSSIAPLVLHSSAPLLCSCASLFCMYQFMMKSLKSHLFWEKKERCFCSMHGDNTLEENFSCVHCWSKCGGIIIHCFIHHIFPKCWLVTATEILWNVNQRSVQYYYAKHPSTQQWALKVTDLMILLHYHHFF